MEKCLHAHGGGKGMNLSTLQLHAIAHELAEAEKSRKPIPPIKARYEGFSVEHAYQVQAINANQGLKTGKRLIGYKIGITSKPIQQRFGVSQPDFGHLFASMNVPDEGEINLNTLIQAKVEGEIALVLGKDLRGPDVTAVDALNAVDYALTAMEIIDSRIEDWKITVEDTIADNGSSALFVLSENKVPMRGLNLAELGMAFSRNGEVILTGSGAAVMGNPINSLVFLANELGRHDKGLLAGEVVLAGSLSGVAPLVAGDFFSCEIWKLGACSMRVK